MRQRWWPFIVIILLLATAVPGRVFAHPEIVRTEPPGEAQLSAAPTMVRIFFSENIEAAFSGMQLFNAQRQRVDAGGGGRSASDPTVLELPLPTIGPGIYTVVWQTIGTDGHKIKGNFVFTVLENAATAVPGAAPMPVPTAAPAVVPTTVAPPDDDTSAASEGVLSTLAALLRALMLLGALGSVGGWVIGAGVLYPALPTNARPARAVVLQRWRLAIGASLGLLIVACLGFVVVQTLIFAGSLDFAGLRGVLFATRLGQALVWRLVLTLLLVAILTIGARQKIRAGKLLLVLLGGLLLTFSLSSHAAAQPNPTLPVLTDWIHLVATATWVGGLILLVVALPATIQALAPKEQVNVLARLIERFSTHALLSVLALTVTGTYAALLHLTVVSDLWTSDYGRALSIKLLLFGALILLGVYNMLIVRPRFTAWTQRAAEAVVMTRWRQRFQWALRSEVALAVLAIGTVGFLTNSPPPSAQVRRPPPAPTAGQAIALPSPIAATPRPTRIPVPSKPFAEIKPVKDLLVGLEVTPASLGENTVLVTVRDAKGAPKDVQKVVLAFEMLEMDMGITETDTSLEGAGRYVATKGWLSMVGDWRVRVIVRRADADDIETEFTVPVGDSAP